MKKMMLWVLALVVLLSMACTALADTTKFRNAYYSNIKTPYIGLSNWVYGLYSNRATKDERKIRCQLIIDKETLSIDAEYQTSTGTSWSPFWDNTSDAVKYNVTILDSNNTYSHLSGSVNATVGRIYVNKEATVKDALAKGGTLHFYIQNTSNLFETFDFSLTVDEKDFANAWMELTGTKYGTYRTANDFEYVISVNDEVYITKYTGEAQKVTIPEKINGLTVTRIDDDAFELCDKITSVTIPNNVKSIGVRAFFRCPNLKSITIPDSLTSIEKLAFVYSYNISQIYISATHPVFKVANGALINKKDNTLVHSFYSLTNKNHTIPQGVITIAERAFQGSLATNITIPNGVTSIEEYAFSFSDTLTRITVPSSVTSIGQNAFLESPNLIIYAEQNSYALTYAKENNLKYLPITSPTPTPTPKPTPTPTPIPIQASVSRSVLEAQLPKASKVSDFSLVQGQLNYQNYSCVKEYNGKNPYIQIPCTWSSRNVTTILSDALYQKGIIDVLLPDTLKLIGSRAFKNSGIYAIYLPNGVENIGDEAFAHCENLQTIIIPSSVSSIGKDAFIGCNPSLLFKVRPSSYAEEYCLEYGFEYTYYYEAEEKALAEVRSKTLYETDGYYFYFIDDDSIAIAASLTALDDITIPDRLYGHPVKLIDSYVFYGGKMRSVTIPASVTSFGNEVFEGCDNLKAIYVYENSYALQYCKDNNLPYEIITENKSVEVKAKASDVYLRNKKGSAITRIDKGDTFYITGYDSDSGLFTAEYNNKTGYVKGTGLNISKDELLGYFK